jgi:hypothetical protein
MAGGNPAAAPFLPTVSPPPDTLPILLAASWLVRAPLVSREEGHEAITRAAWEGLSLDTGQQAALLRGVRAPDVSLAGFLVSALPFAQPRHALRAWSGTSSADAVREVRAFLATAHDRALALPEGPRRWMEVGKILHCLQDSFSPAHVDRVGGRIVRMKHWGPLDLLRGSRDGDEHGFPSDHRDRALQDGALTEEAQVAVEASRRYLETALRQGSRLELEAFLDEFVSGA